MRSIAALCLAVLALAAACSSSDGGTSDADDAGAPSEATAPVDPADVWPPPSAKVSPDAEQFCAAMLEPLELGSVDVRNIRELPISALPFDDMLRMGEARIFMAPDATQAEIDAVATTIADALPGVEVVYRDKASAYSEFRREFSESPQIANSVSAEDMPTSFAISDNPSIVDAITELVADLEDAPGVFEIVEPFVLVVAPVDLNGTTLYELLALDALLPITTIYMNPHVEDADVTEVVDQLARAGLDAMILNDGDLTILRVEPTIDRDVRRATTDAQLQGLIFDYDDAPDLLADVMRQLVDELMARPAAQAAAATARTSVVELSQADLDLLQGFARGVAERPDDTSVYELGAQLRSVVEAECDGPCLCHRDETLYKLADSVADLLDGL